MSSVLVVVIDVAPELAKDPRPTLPPKEESCTNVRLSLEISEPEPPGSESPPDAATRAVDVHLIEPSESAGAESRVVQLPGPTLPTRPERFPVVTLAPLCALVPHFVRRPETVAVERVWAVAVSAGANVTAPVMAQLVGAARTTAESRV
jgi:hypothetical protein